MSNNLLVQLNELKEAYGSAEPQYQDSIQTQIDKLEKQLFTAPRVEPPSYKPPRTSVVQKVKDNKNGKVSYVVVPPKSSRRYMLPPFPVLPPLTLPGRSSKSHLKLPSNSNPDKLTKDFKQMSLEKKATPEDLAKALSTMTTGKLIKKRLSQKRRRRLNTSKKWK